MRMPRRQFLQLAGAAAALPVLACTARAQSWPTKTIRVIIPLSAGSTIDVVARIAFEPLSHQLGHSMVVENRGGAGGMTGTAAVARAEPDGYTVLVHSSAF